MARFPKLPAGRIPVRRIGVLFCALLVGVVGAMLLAALLFYDPVGVSAEGGFAAQAAKGLYWLQTAFGRAAYLLPALMMIWAARLWATRLPKRVGWRLLCIAPALTLAAGYLEAHAPAVGGAAGRTVVNFLVDWIGGLTPSAPYLPTGLLLGAGAVFTGIAAAGFSRSDLSEIAQFLFDSNRDVARAAPEAFRAVRDLREKGGLREKLRNFRTTSEHVDKIERERTTMRRKPAHHPAGAKIAGEVSEKNRPRSDLGGRAARAGDRTHRPKREKPAVVKPAYIPPPLGLYEPAAGERNVVTETERDKTRLGLKQVLEDYGVRGEILDARSGPVVTLYELEPEAGLKASRVIGLADDIARSMRKLSARIATSPGRSTIGIELPNEKRAVVDFRTVLESPAYQNSDAALPLALGKNIAGEERVVDLAKMPHLLIAGTTGSGKSVAINTMILSLLQKLGPEDCRLIMIDPKMLELSVYNNIPHLLAEVVTDAGKAVRALKWVVREMEARYDKMSKLSVRNIASFNERVAEAQESGEPLKRVLQVGFREDGAPIDDEVTIEAEKMPMIVVVVDEMADLMIQAGKEIEGCIQRLAQMARASGIHLIMATQRPSVDVITGTIKANFPTRISFQVTSKIDSRTILGEQGAEQLLGQGDMLYMEGGGRVTRLHGPFVSDRDVEQVVTQLRRHGKPDYQADFDTEEIESASYAPGGGEGGDDDLYAKAVDVVVRDRKVSTSYIQRQLQIGYNRAARIVEQMEERGVVGPASHTGKREILVGGDSA